jgi:pimeloyl-ACP methyl ester carboxylesterase
MIRERRLQLGVGRQAMVAISAPASTEHPYVLVVHGWGLGHRSYLQAAERMASSGLGVVVPSLPGSGGSSTWERPGDLGDYACWLEEVLDELGIDRPLVVVGHSLGGAIAIRLGAHRPACVRLLILVAALGSPEWRRRGPGGFQPLADRPLWDWALGFPLDLLSMRPGLGAIAPLVVDVVPNLLRRPGAMWAAASLARGVDLREDLARLARERVPVVPLRCRRDQVVPEGNFRALCEVLGVEGVEVDGGHAWPLVEPDAFGDLVVELATGDAGSSKGRRPARGTGSAGAWLGSAS